MASAGSSSPSPKRHWAAEALPAAGTDKLMSLPTEILETILERVPFKKLVRTCCLSRAWHRRWESVPNLDFLLPRGSSARTIWRCAAPVRSFRARVHVLAGNSHFFRVARWLRALARKSVQELTLEFDKREFRSKPPVLLGAALFSCATLVDLSLHDCRMPPAPPGFPGFPKLVSLTLCYVAVLFKGDGAQLVHLIAAAPDLEVLYLRYVVTKRSDDHDAVEKWAIRAPPKLRNLTIIIQFFDNGCRIAEELTQLEEASILIDRLIGTQDFLDIFRRIATVHTLWFDTESSQCTVNPLEGITWKFENLRKAHLCVTFGRLPSFMCHVGTYVLTAPEGDRRQQISLAD